MGLGQDLHDRVQEGVLGLQLRKAGRFGYGTSGSRGAGGARDHILPPEEAVEPISEAKPPATAEQGA